MLFDPVLQSMARAAPSRGTRWAAYGAMAAAVSAGGAVIATVSSATQTNCDQVFADIKMDCRLAARNLFADPPCSCLVADLNADKEVTRCAGLTPKGHLELMRDEGTKHLFDRLQARDLAGFDPQKIPMTALRQSEMDNSRGLMDRFFAEWLETDGIVADRLSLSDGDVGVQATALYTIIEAWRERNGHFKPFGWSATAVRQWTKSHSLYKQRRVGERTVRVVVLDRATIAAALALPELPKGPVAFSALPADADPVKELLTEVCEDVAALAQ